MEFNEKVTLSDPKKSPHQKHLDKFLRQMQIILKIAKINGYDIGGRIRDQEGSFIENSSLIHLLTYSMTPGRVLVGEKEFIDLLYEAKVEPDTILNDNIKAKLYKMYNNKSQTEVEPLIEEYKENKGGEKRKRDDDDDEMPNLEPYYNVPIKKRRYMPVLEPEVEVNKNTSKKRRWDYPEDDE